MPVSFVRQSNTEESGDHWGFGFRAIVFERLIRLAVEILTGHFCRSLSVMIDSRCEIIRCFCSGIARRVCPVDKAYPFAIIVNALASMASVRHMDRGAPIVRTEN